jgi:hypothetical protein
LLSSSLASGFLFSLCRDVVCCVLCLVYVILRHHQSSSSLPGGIRYPVSLTHLSEQIVPVLYDQSSHAQKNKNKKICATTDRRRGLWFLLLTYVSYLYTYQGTLYLSSCLCTQNDGHGEGFLAMPFPARRVTHHLSPIITSSKTHLGSRLE